MAAAFGMPQLANVFYYGKEFGTKMQKLDEKGNVIDGDYDALSVVKAGAEGEEQPQEVAEGSKTKDNTIVALLEQILGKSSDAASEDDLRDIVKGA
jgi:hypothetical protein